MICELCKQDRPEHRMRTLVFLRAGWPPLDFVEACRECRRSLKWSVLHRALAYVCYLGLFAAVAAAGFAAVWLILWLVRRASTS